MSLSGQLHFRWRAILGVLVGVGVGFLCSACGLLPGASLLWAWDAALLAYLAVTLQLVLTADAARVKAMAGRNDEGRVVIMGLILAAVLVSVAAIVYAVHESKAPHRHIWAESSPWLTALSFAALVLGWATVQVQFTLHYAHRYFGDRDGDGTADQGLLFPGAEPATYLDFLYVAVCVGATCQVSDFNVTHHRFRNLVTAHAIIAFVYNTMVLALGINIFGALMGQ